MTDYDNPVAAALEAAADVDVSYRAASMTRSQRRNRRWNAAMGELRRREETDVEYIRAVDEAIDYGDTEETLREKAAEAAE